MDDREIFQHFHEIKLAIEELRKETRTIRAEIEEIIDAMEEQEDEPQEDEPEKETGKETIKVKGGK